MKRHKIIRVQDLEGVLKGQRVEMKTHTKLGSQL